MVDLSRTTKLAERDLGVQLTGDKLVVQPERDLNIEFEAHEFELDVRGPITTPNKMTGPVHRTLVWSTRIKRILDVLVSGLGLIVLAPVAIVLIAGVKVSSSGPAFFSQHRVGKNGNIFRLYKFRSMHTGTYEQLMINREDQERYVASGFKFDAGDHRITGFGRFLRSTSLDEVPQLWNVLRGEMSLVGIRPLLTDELYLRPKRDFELYCAMSPGMTGLWQVSGRSSVSEEDRQDLDRQYVEDWTLWSDIRILAATPLAVLRISQTR